jgi:hypothetical protein
MGFGATLLLAAALQWVQGLGARIGTVVLAAIALLILFDRGPLLTNTAMRAVEEHQHPVYDEIGQLTRMHGSGPIIELPRTVTGFSTEVRSMIASLRHGLPLILGRTGYQPPHYLMVQAAVARLPDRDRLRALRTATDLRWILLRPMEQWPAGRRWFRAALLQSPDLERMTLRDGYDMLRVIAEPYDVDWYEAIRLGPQEGRTALGTPLDPVAADDVNVVVLGKVPTVVQCSQKFPFTLRVMNRRETVLPGAGHLRKDAVAPEHAMGVRARLWSTPSDPQAAPVRDEWLAIIWDIPPLGRISQEASLEAPSEPGRYILELTIQQKGGRPLTDPPNEASRVRVIVGRGPGCS